MRIAFAAGGTGGHLYPALAAAEDLRGRDASFEALFFVSRRPRDGETVGRSGFPFRPLPGRGLGGGPAGALAAALGAAGAWAASASVMRRRRIEAVAGFGAYVSVGPVLAARTLGLGIVVHEQNALMGRANRRLARWADGVARGLPPAEGLRRGHVLTGVPVRPSVLSPPGREEARARLGLEGNRFTLLVMGGSQGARALNEAAAADAPLLARGGGVQVVHLSGAEGCGMVRAAYGGAGLPAAVFAYLEEIEWAYAAADLAVCRCGAMTLAEIAASGLPAVLVPFPRAADDHQAVNARVFEAAGAAVVRPEAGLRPGALAGLVRSLMDDPGARRRMGTAARSLAVPDAARRLADLIARAAGRKR
ncbi:MAG: UDP-N-acetylglucosamine--N-acetylmuramyl-(pentapeptide) pyrophosphoryl-undecaprenol N-acetylglucosamine transferase [bacterium]|nr:UDP-N-acetylglucosamine--N-acetylmuramyl-(pentapeptide) pyrophosphoryl-undecaprenol N-acetylglucosamine transferase [bacterium]